MYKQFLVQGRKCSGGGKGNLAAETSSVLSVVDSMGPFSERRLGRLPRPALHGRTYDSISSHKSQLIVYLVSLMRTLYKYTISNLEGIL